LHIFYINHWKVNFMEKTKVPIPVGILMMGLAIICLSGWNFLNWTFVDPYFSTLVFIAGPFFIAMGFAQPRPVPEEDRVRARAR
jgi:hypothetical protein